MTRQHHIKLNGTGFTLADSGGRVAYREGTQNALSIKTAQGDPKFSDQSHLSVWNQTDWRGGRAEDRAEAGNRYGDGNMMTYLKERLMQRSRDLIMGTVSIKQGVWLYQGTADWQTSAYLSAAAPTRKIAQKFTSDGNVNVNHVTLLLGLFEEHVATGAGTLSVRIETDNAGAPSGTLADADATASINISALTVIPAWTRATFAGAVTLAASTAYWIVVAASSHVATAEPVWYITSDTASGGRATYDGATWTTATSGHFYCFEEQAQLAAAPTASAFFNSTFYLAAGTQIYKRVTGADTRWTAVGSPLANAVTDMDVLESTLWICTGKGNNAYTMNTSESFTEMTGITGQLLHTYNGYLYRANGNQLFYTSDGTNWTSQDPDGNTFLFGNSNYNINGMAGLGDGLFVAKADGLFEFARGDIVVGVERWQSQFDTNNGKGMVEWNGALYIPVKQGLVKYDGKSFDADVGPNRDEGLPDGRTGKIVAMVPLLNYLIAAVDATGASDYGSVLLYNGYGWHEIGRTWQAGQRVQMVGFDPTVADWNKIVYNMGRMVGALNDFADATDYASWTQTDSQICGYVETSWIGGGLLDVWKMLSSVWVNIEGENNIHDLEQRIHIDYRVDRQGTWRYLGEVYLGGGHELSFQTADSIGSPGTVASIDADTGAVTLSAIGGIVAGKFVRIGHETRYVTGINGNAFTPLVAYDDAAAGDQPAGGYPTCREVQLRIRFYGGLTTAFPVIRAVRLNWANQLTRWRRWQLGIRCEENILLLDGTRETRTPYQIYTELNDMLEGSTLFVLNDIDEQDRNVQLVNASFSDPEVKYDTVSGTATVQRMGTIDLVEI